MTHKGRRRVAWADLDAEQRACLQTISTACEKRRDAEHVAWCEAQRARDLDIPERMIAERLEVSRTTLLRQLAQRSGSLRDEKRSAVKSPEPPGRPAQVAARSAGESGSTKRRLPHGQRETREDLVVEPAVTGQFGVEGVGTVDAPEDLVVEPAVTGQLVLDEEIEVWSRSCVDEYDRRGPDGTLLDDVFAMPYEEVVAYWSALDDANRRAVVEYLRDDGFLRDHELQDHRHRETVTRFAVVLHQLHVRVARRNRSS